jgi:phospholipid:diacylglycerol acyltransferase
MQAIIAEDARVPEIGDEQSSQESEEHDELDASPKESLTRSTTREEITQTDDELLPTVEKVKRSWLQYRRIIFILGIIMGLVVAWAFRSPDLQLEGLFDSVDMADFFDDLKAALPSALPIGLVKEAKEIQQHSRQTAGTGAFSIGERMYMDGKVANYPVVMVNFSVPTSHKAH